MLGNSITKLFLFICISNTATQNCEKRLEALELEKGSTLSTDPTTVNEKLQELELLLHSRDRKVQFLEEEHKKEVIRASEAEETTSVCRYIHISVLQNNNKFYFEPECSVERFLCLPVYAFK